MAAKIGQNKDPGLSFDTLFAMYQKLAEAGFTQRDAEKIIKNPVVAKRLIGWLRSGHWEQAPHGRTSLVPSQPPPEVTRRRSLHPDEIVDLSESLYDTLAPGIDEQIAAWHLIANELNLPISDQAFANIPGPPELNADDTYDGLLGVALFYGFNSKDQILADLENEQEFPEVTVDEEAPSPGGESLSADMHESLLRSWLMLEHRVESDDDLHIKTKFKFNNNFFRIRRKALPRPRGFYWAKIQLGWLYAGIDAPEAIKQMRFSDTAMAFEALQLMAVTHPGICNELDGVRIPGLILGDLEVAPDGDAHYTDNPLLPYVCRMNSLIILDTLPMHLPEDIKQRFGLATIRIQPMLDRDVHK